MGAALVPFFRTGEGEANYEHILKIKIVFLAWPVKGYFLNNIFAGPVTRKYFDHMIIIFLDTLLFKGYYFSQKIRKEDA